jgi:hypothetical protein
LGLHGKVLLSHYQNLMGYLDLGFMKFLQRMLCQFGKDFGILFNFHCLNSNVERIFSPHALCFLTSVALDNVSCMHLFQG